MAWYIFVGHNWNAAATSIDYRIGTMEGYTAIVCEGSVPSVSEQYLSSVSQPMLEEENMGVLEMDADPARDDVVTLDDALDAYGERDAQVIAIRTGDYGFYEDAVIVPRQGKRMAVFSVKGPRSDLAAKNVAKELKRRDVDFIICLVDDIESVERGMGPVDLAFCTDYDAAGAEGRYVGGTYVIGAPYVGTAAAAIMAPSGFLSSKTIEAL